MKLVIPESLTASCYKTPERAAWLSRLPEAVSSLRERWSLTLASPFVGEEVSAAWVAPARRPDGTPVVLKIGMPHMEARDEIDGLRFWDADPTVRLLDYDRDLNAMLLERCVPGTVLRSLPEPDQDVVIAGLLRCLWRPVPAPHSFRPLSEMTASWSEETIAKGTHLSPDAGLVREGLSLFSELAIRDPRDVLLATDLHAGNVLRAQREPWLVIDPKPFVGDPAYDATQHLFNCEERLRRDPLGTIRRFADLLGLEAGRVSRWMFARAAAEPRDKPNTDMIALANALAAKC